MGDGDREADLFRRLARGSGTAFAGEVLRLGISFVGAAVVARLIGPLDFGAVSLGSKLLIFLSIVSLVGLQTGVARYLPRFEGDARRRGVIVSALQIVVPLSVGVAVVVILSAGLLSRRVFTDPSLAPVLVVFGAAIPFAAFTKLAVGTMRGHERVLPRVLMTDLTIPGVRLVVAAAAIFLGYGVAGVAFGYAFAYVVAATIGGYVMLRYTSVASSVAYDRLHGELLGFSAPLTVSQIMSRVLVGADTFLIAFFLTTDRVGVYAVVYPLAGLLLVTLQSAGFVFEPIISELHSNSEFARMEQIYHFATKWTLLGSIPVFVLVGLFPETSIGLTYGPAYTSGAMALTILTVGFLFHTAVGPVTSILTSAGLTRHIMIVTSTTAVGNIVLNLVLIPRYGIIGAAVATTVSYIVMNLANMIELHRRLDIVPFSKTVLKPGAVAIFVAATVRIIPELTRWRSTAAIVALYAAFLAVYPAVILRYGGIEEAEVQLLTDVEHKFGVDFGPLKNVLNKLM